MLPLQLPPEPLDFDERVRRPGLRAIDEMLGRPPRYPRLSGKRCGQVRVEVSDPTTGVKHERLAQSEDELPPGVLPDYWTRALGALSDAYGHVCAYSCFRVHEVTGASTVDHWAPKSRAPSAVYEWDNYRFASQLLNARKRDFEDVLDPCQVGPWFALDVYGYQVQAAQAFDQDTQAQVEDTIRRLQLNSATMIQARERRARQYLDGDVAFHVLLQESPFVALEFLRQDHLLQRDCWPWRVWGFALMRGAPIARADALGALSGLTPRLWTHALRRLHAVGWMVRVGRNIYEARVDGMCPVRRAALRV